MTDNAWYVKHGFSGFTDFRLSKNSKLKLKLMTHQTKQLVSRVYSKYLVSVPLRVSENRINKM